MGRYQECTHKTQACGELMSNRYKEKMSALFTYARFRALLSLESLTVLVTTDNLDDPKMNKN
jgi:hypothetical protein